MCRCRNRVPGPGHRKTRADQRVPHDGDDGRVGVVGVEDRRLGTGVLVAGQQRTQPVAFGGERLVARVEDLRHGPHTDQDASKHALLGGGGRALRCA